MVFKFEKDNLKIYKPKGRGVWVITVIMDSHLNEIPICIWVNLMEEESKTI